MICESKNPAIVWKTYHDLPIDVLFLFPHDWDVLCPNQKESRNGHRLQREIVQLNTQSLEMTMSMIHLKKHLMIKPVPRPHIEISSNNCSVSILFHVWWPATILRSALHLLIISVKTKSVRNQTFHCWHVLLELCRLWVNNFLPWVQNDVWIFIWTKQLENSSWPLWILVLLTVHLASMSCLIDQWKVENLWLWPLTPMTSDNHPTIACHLIISSLLSIMSSSLTNLPSIFNLSTNCYKLLHTGTSLLGSDFSKILKLTVNLMFRTLFTHICMVTLKNILWHGAFSWSSFAGIMPLVRLHAVNVVTASAIL